MIEWNVHDPSGQEAAAGMWDSHIRLYSQCPPGSVNSACQAAFLGIHLTSGSSAYLEGAWVWTADHDLDTSGSSEISIFTGRGILSESHGPVWLIGICALVNAQNRCIGLAQTETSYYQPSPAAPAPYSTASTYNDPTFSSSISIGRPGECTFSLRTTSSYLNYSQDGLTTNACQAQIFNVDSVSNVIGYSASTIGTIWVGRSSNNADGFQETFTAWSE
ncbi:exo-beta-1,3-glucanase [Suillus plorans]|uniref:Exo-beta-1,3-glucanase n=1 Tax=Suillus plorans TaxID=116603 RepID=A0A9P7A9P6_9AGAM|nr:exo-beta-1,3-glucanase [Suillus plorans]KAG1785002.1 exo-beta-1,3-glucanase [Suillus plorans]